MTNVRNIRIRWGANGALTLAAAVVVTALASPALAAERSPERIVRLAPGTSPAEGRAIVRRAGGEVTRDLHLIHSLAARLNGREAARVARDNRIAAVQRNAGVVTTGTKSSGTTTKKAYDGSTLVTAFNQSVKSDKVWDSAGATGRGIGVAVVDTGVDGDLPDFANAQGSSRVIASVVTNPEATTADDTFGHGTHVAGLIAGNGYVRSSRDPLRGRYAGAAPDANLISIKASDDDGNATVLDVIYGLQFAVDHKSTYNIRVVNLSLNSTVAASYETDPLDAAVEAAWLNGLVVVTAAGNRGTASDAVHYPPANDPYIVVVGAADDRSTKSIEDDELAAWSSRGTTQDGFAKPDIIAPGARLVSTLAPGSAFERLCPSCIRDGQYIQAGGTSMASAVAAGVAATILEANPGWTPDDVKTALVETFRPVHNVGREIAADQAAKADLSTLKRVNTGLKPSSLIDRSTGTIDYSRASWSRASWSDAVDALRASWSRASWSCDCSRTADGGIDPSRASWSRASWSMSWTK